MTPGSIGAEDPQTHREAWVVGEAVIRAEAAALLEVIPGLQTPFPEAVALLAGITGKVVVTGLGKSGIVAHKIAATLASTGTPACFLHAAEAAHGDLGLVQRQDAILMISASGTTAELVGLLPRWQALGLPVLGLLGRQGTALARSCHVVLPIGVAREGCPLNLAPTSSSTVAMAVGDALAAALLVRRNFTAADFAQLHPSGFLGRRLGLCARDVMHCGEVLPVVGAEATFREVLLELTRPNLGAVCVVEDPRVAATGCLPKLVGIITDGDVRRHLLRDGTDPLRATAASLMTRQPRTARPDQPLDEVLSLLERHHIYVAPVVDPEGRLVGLLRMHDILGPS